MTFAFIVQVSRKLINIWILVKWWRGIDLIEMKQRLLLLLLLLSRFSRVRLCATPQTAAHQAPPSLGFSRQEHWSGLPFPSPLHESEKWKWSWSVSVRLFVTPWTAAYQAPLSMGFSRQEYWSGLPLPSPETKTKIIQFMERETYCPSRQHSMDLRYVFKYDRKKYIYWK